MYSSKTPDKVSDASEKKKRFVSLEEDKSSGEVYALKVRLPRLGGASAVGHTTLSYSARSARVLLVASQVIWGLLKARLLLY